MAKPKYLCLWVPECEAQTCECRVMLANGKVYCKNECIGVYKCRYRRRVEDVENPWWGDASNGVLEDFSRDDWEDLDDQERRERR